MHAIRSFVMSEMAQSAEEATGRYKIREAVAIFDDYDDLLDAIEELEVAGFDRAQIKLMLSCKSAERKLGHPIEDMRELEDEPGVPLGGWVDRYELAEGKAALTTGLAYVGSLVGDRCRGGGRRRTCGHHCRCCGSRRHGRRIRPMADAPRRPLPRPGDQRTTVAWRAPSVGRDAKSSAGAASN